MSLPPRRARTLAPFVVALAAGVIGLAAPSMASASSWGTVSDPTTQIVYGISCPSVTTCFGAAGAGAIITTTNAGSTWTSQTSHDTQNFAAISCATTVNCVATGADVDVLSGGTWTQASSPTGNVLEGVSCATTTFCVAVGLGTTTAKYTGSSWTTTTTANQLTAVSCVSTTLCRAVGQNVVETFNGTSWSSTSVTGQFTGISCVTASFCIAVGNQVTATYNGSTWSTQSTTNQYEGVSCSSITFCAGVGLNGVIEQYDGSAWSAMTSNTTQLLNSIGLALGGVAGAAGGNVGTLDVLTCVSGTTLSLAGAPSSLTLPNVTLTGADQTVSTSAIALDADDQTTNYAGWNIQASATQLTTGTFTLPNTAVAVSSIAVGAASDVCVLPTNTIVTPVTLSSTPAKIYSAALGTGVGGADITPTVKITIPGDAHKGTYTSTWSFTIVSGP